VTPARLLYCQCFYSNTVVNNIPLREQETVRLANAG